MSLYLPFKRNVLIQKTHVCAWNYHCVIIGKGEWGRVTTFCAQLRGDNFY